MCSHLPNSRPSCLHLISSSARVKVMNFNTFRLSLLRFRRQAKDIMCDYEPGLLENSAKMVLLFHLIEESVRSGDKLLVFRWAIGQTKACHVFLTQCCFADFLKKPVCSQSLSTLTVIEDFLAKRPVPPSPNGDKPNQNWVRNLNYYSESSTHYIRCRQVNRVQHFTCCCAQTVAQTFLTAIDLQ